MGTTEELKRRIQAFAEQLHSEFGDVSVPDGECWLEVVEDIAVEVGDAFATAFVESESASTVRDMGVPNVKEFKPKFGFQTDVVGGPDASLRQIGYEKSAN